MKEVKTDRKFTGVGSSFQCVRGGGEAYLKLPTLPFSPSKYCEFVFYFRRKIPFVIIVLPVNTDEPVSSSLLEVVPN